MLQFGELDVSVTVTTCGAFLLAGDCEYVKPALGAPAQTPGVAVGDGVGVALDDGTGVGVATAADGTGGSVATCVVDAALKVMFCELPKKIAISGVRSVKWPVTRTVTRLGTCAGQPLVSHVTAMSLGAIVTPDDFASSWTRQTTRFELASAGQGCALLKSVGVFDAWNAPSRAAFVTVTRANASRPRSRVVANSRRKTGRISPNSTR